MNGIKLIGFTTLLCGTFFIVGCEESENAKAKRLVQEKSERQYKDRVKKEADDKVKIIEDFKKSPLFTLKCKGDYYLKIKEKQSYGNQSFWVSIDPQEYVAHFFNFEATGSYDSDQQKINNEIWKVSGVDEDWIFVDGPGYSRGYKFNRRTMKFTYSSVVKGVCVKSSLVLKIPTQVL